MSTYAEDLATFDAPHVVMGRLTDIERDLATRQGPYELAASSWFKARREQGYNSAVALKQSEAPSVTAQKADADIAAYMTPGAEFEAEFEAIRSVLKVLETRSMILMAILKAHGRA